MSTFDKSVLKPASKAEMGEKVERAYADDGRITDRTLNQVTSIDQDHVPAGCFLDNHGLPLIPQPSRWADDPLISNACPRE